MAKFKSILLAVVLALCMVFAVACETEVISAYDIAVKNGFSGTEAEWLASLNGKDGKDGTDGKNGSDLTVTDVYDEAVKNGFSGTFLEFLEEYLSFEQAEDNTAAINKGLRSAMLVQCIFTKKTYTFPYGESTQQYSQSGAGVIYSINKDEGIAYIITNYHVVYSSSSTISTHVSDTITVTPYGGSAMSVSYVGGSATYDIAVLKVTDEYFSSDFPIAVTLASDDVSVGQTAIAIGNPAGYGLSVTQGIVSVDSETITMEGIENSSDYVAMRVMRIDTAVNSGNSGGGLFDINGSLIGIVNAKSSDTSIENMAYAIPVSIASAVADNIINNNGAFSKGTVGITYSIAESKAYLDTDGFVKVTETVTIASAEGAAEDKLAEGDVVLSVTVDDIEYVVTRSFHLTDPLLRTKSGAQIKIKVLRENEEKEFEITLS